MQLRKNAVQNHTSNINSSIMIHYMAEGNSYRIIVIIPNETSCRNRNGDIAGTVVTWTTQDRVSEFGRGEREGIDKKLCYARYLNLLKYSSVNIKSIL